MTIKAVKARQIFDSRGNPTVEVDVTTEKGKAQYKRLCTIHNSLRHIGRLFLDHDIIFYF